jgi:hypothetical protein
MSHSASSIFFLKNNVLKREVPCGRFLGILLICHLGETDTAKAPATFASWSILCSTWLFVSSSTLQTFKQLGTLHVRWNQCKLVRGISRAFHIWQWHHDYANLSVTCTIPPVAPAKDQY